MMLDATENHGALPTSERRFGRQAAPFPTGCLGNKLTALAAAVALSGGLAACGGGGGSATMMPEPTPTPQETCEADGGRRNADMTCTSAADLAAEMAVSEARTAAAIAATEAGSAADAAEAAANAQMANMSADETSYALAQNAAMRARTASDAASAARDAAAATDDPVEAEKQQGIAENQQAIAETERDNAVMYAGMVADAQQAIDDENQRVMDVADARMRAMQSYMDADADATKAEGQAVAAEAAAPGSPGAMAARTAATAARTAADAAKAAHDAIMDGMSKADADAQADMAATQAGNANSSYMTAKSENDTIQTNVATNEELQRQRDVAAATTAASEAATDARAAATAARMSATSARTAATAANMAYMRAMAARTDSDEAKMQADAADAAAAAAENAAMVAEAAADAAEAAHMGIDASGSGADAKAAQMTAEMKQGEAETARDTASTQYMTAMTASGDAATAASVRVLSLFLAANGAHVEDDEATMTVDEKAAHVTSVGAALAAIAAVADGAQTGATGTTASATWPGDTVDDPATEATDEFMAGNLSIAVDPNGSGTAIPFELRESRAATDLNGDGDTTDDGEARIINTARMIDDLGVFQGFDLWEDDGDATTNTDRARAIVFTNKQKGEDSKLEVTAVAARSVTNQAVATDGSELAKVTSSGSVITGVEWTPSREAALTGTLSCPANTACSITLGDDGAVTAIAGYTFTGSRAAVEAVTAAAAVDSHEYLIFGLWLDESADGTTDTIGAFADGGVVGGADYAVNVQNAVTGTATYEGVAAGAHHKTGEGVNWFSGDAMLTANFGAIDTDAERGTDPPADTSPGTISGEISNIRVNGGPAMSDSIELRQAALTDGTATFNGNARMGAGEIQDDDTVEYPYNGTWSGSFYGATADDTDTTDVNESVTAPLAAAGTFGVTMSEGTGDDTVVESFVGAFGAHLDD